MMVYAYDVYGCMLQQDTASAARFMTAGRAATFAASVSIASRANLVRSRVAAASPSPTVSANSALFAKLTYERPIDCYYLTRFSTRGVSKLPDAHKTVLRFSGNVDGRGSALPVAPC